MEIAAKYFEKYALRKNIKITKIPDNIGDKNLIISVNPNFSKYNIGQSSHWKVKG